MAVIKQYMSRSTEQATEETAIEVIERKKAAEWIALQLEALRMQDEYFISLQEQATKAVYGKEQEKLELERDQQMKKFADRLSKLANSCLYVKEEAEELLDVLYDDTMLRQSMYWTVAEIERERELAQDYLERLVADLAASPDKPSYIVSAQQGIKDAAVLVCSGNEDAQQNLLSGINRDLYYNMVLDMIDSAPDEAESLLGERSIAEFSKEFMGGDQLFADQTLIELNELLEKKRRNDALSEYIHEYVALLAPGGDESAGITLAEASAELANKIPSEYKLDMEKKLQSIYSQYEAAKKRKREEEDAELCLKLINGIINGEIAEYMLEAEPGFNRLGKKQQSILIKLAAPDKKPKFKPNAKPVAVYRADLWDAMVTDEVRDACDLLAFEAGGMAFADEPYTTVWAVELLGKIRTGEDYFMQAVAEVTPGAPDKMKRAVMYYIMLYALESRLDLFNIDNEDKLSRFAKVAAAEAKKGIIKHKF